MAQNSVYGCAPRPNLCWSLHKHTSEDLDEAENTLLDLEDIGFKLDWLKMKRVKVYMKKKQKQDSSVQIRELQEKVQKPIRSYCCCTLGTN